MAATSSTTRDLQTKVAEYQTKGPLITHLPEFVKALQYFFKVYQKRLSKFG